MPGPLKFRHASDCPDVAKHTKSPSNYLEARAWATKKLRTHDVLIDAQTAAVLVAVHDGLNPVNQACFAALPVERAAKIAWRLAS